MDEPLTDTVGVQLKSNIKYRLHAGDVRFVAFCPLFSCNIQKDKATKNENNNKN